MMIICFTTFNLSTISQARVLAATVRKHHPSWRLIGGLVDAVASRTSIDLSSEPFDEIFLAQDVLSNVFDSPSSFSSLQLDTMMRVALLLQLSETSGADAVIHLAPDTVLFRPLTSIERLVCQYDIMMIPRVTEAEDDQGQSSTASVLAFQAGVYDPGLIAVRALGEGLRFARWWKGKLLTPRGDAVDVGGMDGQRWCDQAPALFDKLHILRDRSYNVRNSNLVARNIALDGQGELSIDGSALHSWRFAELANDENHPIAPYDRRQHLVREVWLWYQRALIGAG